MDKKENYIVYKITNKINSDIYIGCHSTDNVYDNYMGSGTNIKKSIDEFGSENFDKIVLYNFNNKEDMMEKEAKLVNKEFIKRKDTYNIIIGGGYNTTGTLPVRDEIGNILQVSVSDPRYLSGELVYYSKGYITVIDKKGETSRVSVSDPRYLSGELKHTLNGYIVVKDDNGGAFKLSTTDPRYLSGEFTGISKDTVVVKDSNNNYFRVSVSDPRYLNKELLTIWEGKKHTTETKRKIGEKNSKKQKGNKNSQYGTCWIYNNKENKKIRKSELDDYLKNNWIKGRKIKF